MAGGTIAAQLVLGGLDEEPAFVDFDVDCDVDLILGYDWLRSHGLTCLYDTNEVCICTERAAPRAAASASISPWTGLLRLRRSSCSPKPWLYLGPLASVPPVPPAAHLSGPPRQAARPLPPPHKLLQLFLGLVGRRTRRDRHDAHQRHRDFHLQHCLRHGGADIRPSARRRRPPDFATLAGEYADVLAAPPARPPSGPLASL